MAEAEPDESSAQLGVLRLQSIHAINTVEFALSGELDLSNAAELQRILMLALREISDGGTSPRLIINLRSLEFIDSTGLLTLMLTKVLSDSLGVHLSVKAGQSQPARKLAMAQLDKFLCQDPSTVESERPEAPPAA